MDSLVDICSPLKLVFVTGKGGIGKSLASSSLALKFHSLGKRVLLVQQAASDHLGPLVGYTGVTHEGVELRPGLTVVNYTPSGNFKDFVVKHLKHGSLFESLAGNKLVHGFFTAIPGFGELMLLGRLYYVLNLATDRPDIVIVDSYASGHFMSLMTTPEAVLQSGLAGPISVETGRVREFLSNRSVCGTIVMGVPEELVVSEMLDFIPRLQIKAPVAVRGVVFNRDLTTTALPAVTNGGVAFDFLSRRVAKQKAALELWRIGANQSFFSGFSEARIPEFGFIDDPLSNEVVDRVVGTTNGRGVP